MEQKCTTLAYDSFELKSLIDNGFEQMKQLKCANAHRDSISQLPWSRTFFDAREKKINQKMNHWTNNLKRLNILKENTAIVDTSVWKWKMKIEKKTYPSKLQGIYCQHFFSLYFGRWVHDWIISEDFMCALSYIFCDYCFPVSSTFCFHNISFFGI